MLYFPKRPGSIETPVDIGESSAIGCYQFPCHGETAVVNEGGLGEEGQA